MACIDLDSFSGIVSGPMAGALVLRESGRKPRRLFDEVRRVMRTHHLSRSTERAYVGWIRRFIRFHGRRHPSALGEAEVSA